MEIDLELADCCPQPEQVAHFPEGRRTSLASLFHALGDPTRLQIFRLIAEQTEPICVCHIVDRFDVTQPTISHHLKVLREAGLVSVSRRGVWAYYAVNDQKLGVLTGAMEALRPKSEVAQG